jgi:3-deoxy-D-manno-octulosonic-acid transferase
MIYLYHLLSFLLLPLYILFLLIRLAKGKEDKSRIFERFGVSNRKRPAGYLIWFHAASVGESLATISLMQALNSTSDKKLNFLITTGTKTSAVLLKKRLPENAIHQFLPVDNIIFIRIFLQKWCPDLAIIIEAEIWPCLITQVRRCCKLLLMNARLSDKSFQRWKKVAHFFRFCMAQYDQIIVQSEKDFIKFQTLGVRNITNLGNIKFANKKLEANPAEQQSLIERLNNRKIVVFASTHAEDEAHILPIILNLKNNCKESYFILAPRHPSRKAEIEASCKAHGLKCSFRTQVNIPNLEDDLYIADTLGELGLFYSICYIAFVGGSFNQGGHSPLEPAHFGKLIIFGPDMSNAADIAREMIESKAALQISNSIELSKLIDYFLSDSGRSEYENYSSASLGFITKHSNVLQNYLLVIQKFLH